MTAHDELLAAIPAIASEDGTFAVGDVVNELRRRGSRYRESTIRTHVASRMCRDTPDHHAVTYDDLAQAGPGRYRLLGGNGR